MNKENPFKDSDACERCTKKIECRSDDISSCDCTKMELSEDEYFYISQTYKMCLCNTCLSELKLEYKDNKSGLSVKKTLTCLFFLNLFLGLNLHAQTYAPPVGQPGTSAVYMDSSVFVNWASACTITRGYQDISNTTLGYASVGDNSMATGKAQSNAVVSLGDGGSAVCTFNKRIINGQGYDFAVFENGFDDVFLELAFVEVSSDGVNFFRFPSHSLTDTALQTESFGSTDAKEINNLAGKYRGGYGTPFDLQELSGKAGLDINSISHVKVIDVVGSMDIRYASRDAYNNKVNDPWPTPYPSGGFDLDAIGVIHESGITFLGEEKLMKKYSVYPNPVNSGDEIKVDISGEFEIELLDASGKCILISTTSSIQTSGLSAGMYCLKINSESKYHIQKIIVCPY